MNTPRNQMWQSLAKSGNWPAASHAHAGHHPIGHAHFWERAMSRRQFLRTATGAAVAVFGAGLWAPSLTRAAGPEFVPPKPIPGTISPPFSEIGPIHHFLPSANTEPSQITDFNGFVAVAEIGGVGKTSENLAEPDLLYEVDMRFMQGVYIGVDGMTHRATFTFI